MGAISRAVDQLFKSELGRDATYYPKLGAAFAVRVITKQPDKMIDFGGAQVSTDTTVIDVRVVEVATPAEGDQIDLAGILYTVFGPARREDSDRLIWTLDTAPSA